MLNSTEPDGIDPTLQAATDLLGLLRHERFEDVRGALAAPLRLAVPAQIIADLWAKATWSTGPIEDVSDVQYHRKGLFPVVKALVRFQKGVWATTISLTPLNGILGFYLHQPILMGLTEAWQPPDYVREAMLTETAVKVNPFWLFPGVEATIAVPKNSGRKPAVLFLQGSGMSDLDISIGAQKPGKDIAWGLASAGVVVLRIGKPIAWLAFKQGIAGNVTAVDEYLYSGIRAIEILARHPEVDSARIYVAGLSMGGRVAPRLCLQASVPIAGMISIAGLAQTFCQAFIQQAEYTQQHFPKDEKEHLREIARFQELSDSLQKRSLTNKSPNPIASLPIPLPLSYFIDDEEHQPTHLVKHLKMRILVCQGMQDWQVPAEANVHLWREALESHSAKGQATFRVYHDLSHTMIAFEGEKVGMMQYEQPGHVAAEVIADVVAWINQGNENMS